MLTKGATFNLAYLFAYIALIVANIVLHWNLPWWVFALAASPIIFILVTTITIFVLGFIGLLDEKPNNIRRWRA